MTGRRTLLAAFSASVLAGPWVRAGAGEAPEKVSDAKPWDVIVAGAGAAGLCAAVSALEQGARRVLVLEKGPIAGGHSALSSGSVAVAMPRPDSANPREEIEALAREIVENGGGASRPELALTLAEGSFPVYRWLSGLGLPWEKRRFRAVGSLSALCFGTGSPQGGFEFVKVLLKAARRLGAEIRLRSPVTELVTDAEGRVTGVRAQTRDGAGKSRSDILRARSVVLATGGFTGNVAMRMRYFPELDRRFATTANPRRNLFDGSTGDGIRMGVSAGAALTGMNFIQIIPFSGGRLLDYVGGEMWVNETGERFVPEGVPYSQLYRVINPLEEPRMWCISDSRTRKGATIGVKLTEGVVRTAQSVEEMASGMGVESRVLEASLARYNASARSGWDEQFGVPMDAMTIETPPFYYGLEIFSVHFTCGGLAIDTGARVLDEARTPVAGLFAAGETTGGVHGEDRLGGCGLLDAFVFGRIAGKNAARNAARESGSS